MPMTNSTDWPKKSFAECATLLSGGTPSKKVDRYWGGDIPWVSAKDLKVSRISTSEDFVTEDGAQNGTRLVPSGTILFVVRGMSLAKEFRIGVSQLPLTFNQDLKALRVHEGVDTTFLYYWLVANTRNIIGSTGEAAHGTKKLETDRILSLQIAMPPFPQQQRIARYFANFDDLIENNRQRIELLQESAQRTYREWFVNLRFYDHESATFVGGLPESWREEPLKDWLESHIGGGWGEDGPTSSHSEPGFVIRGTDLPNVSVGKTGSVPFRFHKASNIASRTLADGDIVFEVSGGSKGQPVGRTLLVTGSLVEGFPESVICASFCKKLRPADRQTSEYLDLHFKFVRDAGLMDAFATQSASNITNFKFSAFLEQHRILRPAVSVLEHFQSIVAPVYKQIRVLGQQTQSLAEARDLLLPRIMSGEIEV